jgi:hypothetical protein
MTLNIPTPQISTLKSLLRDTHAHKPARIAQFRREEENCRLHPPAHLPTVCVQQEYPHSEDKSRKQKEPVPPPLLTRVPTTPFSFVFAPDFISTTSDATCRPSLGPILQIHSRGRQRFQTLFLWPPRRLLGPPTGDSFSALEFCALLPLRLF